MPKVFMAGWLCHSEEIWNIRYTAHNWASLVSSSSGYFLSNSTQLTVTLNAVLLMVMVSDALLLKTANGKLQLCLSTLISPSSTYE